MIMKRIALFALAIALAAGAAWAQSDATVSQLVATALSGNLDLAKARAALAAAEADLPWKSELANTRLTLSAAADAGGTGGVSVAAEAGVSVPIVPQLSVYGSVTSKGTASAGLTLTPFASAEPTYQETETYRKALAQVAFLERQVRYQAEAAAWSLTEARAEVTAAESAQALKEQLADVGGKAYALGDITSEDLENARSALTAARQAVYSAQRALLAARSTVFQLVGSTEETAVADATVGELSALVASRDTAIAALPASTESALAVQTLLIELDALNERLAATPAYSPNLSISARLSWPLSASAGVSFSFSASDLKTTERAEIIASIAMKEKELVLARSSAGFQAKIRSQALSVAKQALAGRIAELKLAETASDEAALLLSQGQRTSFEAAQARLDLDDAEAGVYAATVAVLSAQADILLAAGS
jgi:outer membrane protein TolC